MSHLGLFQKDEGKRGSMQFMSIIVPKMDNTGNRKREEGNTVGKGGGYGWEVESSSLVEFQQLQRKRKKHIVKEIRGIVRGENPLYFNPIWV